MQFPGMPNAKQKIRIPTPQLHFQTTWLTMRITRVELFWVASETDDAIAVWLPEQGVLYGGAAFTTDAIPNIGTPLRTQRFTVRWAESSDGMLALNPEILLTEFALWSETVMPCENDWRKQPRPSAIYVLKLSFV